MTAPTTAQINTNAALLPAIRRADEVITVGDVRGWERPSAYTQAYALLTAARQAERAIPDAQPTPTTPRGVSKWIERTVEQRVRAATRQAVIHDLTTSYGRAVYAAGIEVVGSYITRLVGEFAVLVDEFSNLSHAPRELTGNETPEDVEEHVAALRCASGLTLAASHRLTLANAAQENDRIGSTPLWLVLAPTAHTRRDALNEALAAFHHRLPATLTEWDSIANLGLGLAELGQVADRRDEFAYLLDRTGYSTADGGQHDRSYGQMVDAIGTPHIPGVVYSAIENDALIN